ncbi:TPA: AAA family ATPase, partial [Escherichia coli]
MIILVASQKGGCGKSTTSVNICAELARANKDVVLLDADKQGTSARWASDRNAAEVSPVIHCVQKFGNIRETLLDLDKRYEFVVVDTAGR